MYKQLLASMLIATLPATLLAQGKPDMSQSTAQDAAAGAEVEQLRSSRANFTALRVDQEGNPLARIDIFLRDALLGESDALDLAAEFSFAGEGDMRDAERRERTILLPQSLPIESVAEVGMFDPDMGSLVEVRRVDSEMLYLTCSNTFLTAWNGSRSTGTNLYWYAYSDGISAHTGPQRYSSADPDIFLYMWTGSTYQYMAGDFSSFYMDGVRGINGACYTRYWRTKVRFHNGGPISVQIVLTSAS